MSAQLCGAHLAGTRIRSCDRVHTSLLLANSASNSAPALRCFRALASQLVLIASFSLRRFASLVLVASFAHTPSFLRTARCSAGCCFAYGLFLSLLAPVLAWAPLNSARPALLFSFPMLASLLGIELCALSCMALCAASCHSDLLDCPAVSRTATSLLCSPLAVIVSGRSAACWIGALLRTLPELLAPQLAWILLSS